jgi:hypothetical protein
MLGPWSTEDNALNNGKILRSNDAWFPILE